MNLRVISDRALEFNGKVYRCAVGKRGFSQNKTEGDNCTPIGTWPLRECWWRADKLASKPQTALFTRMIGEDDGWCDAPLDWQYNRHVKLPYEASHEALWRKDDVYDVIVPLGYNDAPITPQKGSAIFMHVAKPDFAGTEGCVALALPDLLEILAQVDADTQMEIAPQR